MHRTHLAARVFLFICTRVHLTPVYCSCNIFRATTLAGRCRLLFCLGSLFCERDYSVTHCWWPFCRRLTEPLGSQFSPLFFRKTPFHHLILSLYFMIPFLSAFTLPVFLLYEKIRCFARVKNENYQNLCRIQLSCEVLNAMYLRIKLWSFSGMSRRVVR